jgi:hypothetical protein
LVGVFVLVGVGVNVGVFVSVAVLVTVDVKVGVAVSVAVFVGVEVASLWAIAERVGCRVIRSTVTPTTNSRSSLMRELGTLISRNLLSILRKLLRKADSPQFNDFSVAAISSAVAQSGP